MTQLNPTYGAAFVGKISQRSPHDLMRQLMDENPGAPHHKIDKLFVDAVLNDPDLNRACVSGFAVNVRMAVERLASAPASSIVIGRLKEVKRTKASVKFSGRSAGESIRAAILDFVMPNGKTLRDCTFREVAQAGDRFAKIAAMGRPNQVVGKVLTDEQAARL